MPTGRWTFLAVAILPGVLAAFKAVPMASPSVLAALAALSAAARASAGIARFGRAEANEGEVAQLMALDVENVCVELITALKPLLPAIRKHNPSLALQLVRAADSVALNTSEGAGSDGGNRRARYCSAAGSAREARMALRVAAAWGCVSEDKLRRPFELLDRISAMLWKLSRPA